MANAKPKRKKKNRRGGAKKKGGVMIGMRRGFKKTANAVVGSKDDKTASKGSWKGTALTILLLAAAVGFFLYRRG